MFYAGSDLIFLCRKVNYPHKLHCFVKGVHRPYAYAAGAAVFGAHFSVGKGGAVKTAPCGSALFRKGGGGLFTGKVADNK